MAGTIRYGVLITLRDQISQGLGKVRKRLQGLGQATERTSRYARRGLMGLAGALGTVLYFAGQQEQADVELAAALDKIGAAATDALPDLKAFASGVQDVTRYGDEAVEGAMTQMVNIAASRASNSKRLPRPLSGSPPPTKWISPRRRCWSPARRKARRRHSRGTALFWT